MSLYFQDVIPCLLDSPDSILQTLLSRKGRDYVIACVATMETANRVSQQLKSLCWPVTVCVDGEGFEKLLQKDIVISKHFRPRTGYAYSLLMRAKNFEKSGIIGLSGPKSAF